MNSTTHVSKARMWPQKHRSGNVTWKVEGGKKNDGKTATILYNLLEVKPFSAAMPTANKVNRI